MPFCQNHFAAERGLSANTIGSCSNCIKRLIRFACARCAAHPENLDIDLFSREWVIDLFDDLESTRNQWLAPIKPFFYFLASNAPELMHLNETIQAIRQKQTEHTPPPKRGSRTGVCSTEKLIHHIFRYWRAGRSRR